MITTVGRLTPVHQMTSSRRDRRAMDVECKTTKPVHCSVSVPVGTHGGSVADIGRRGRSEVPSVAAAPAAADRRAKLRATLCGGLKAASGGQFKLVSRRRPAN